jgi:hypothetical protein
MPLFVCASTFGFLPPKPKFLIFHQDSKVSILAKCGSAYTAMQKISGSTSFHYAALKERREIERREKDGTSKLFIF